jgi:hypothetical protein
MDDESATPGFDVTDNDGQYVRRALTLMARRAELFTAAPARSPVSVPAVVPTPQDRPQRPRRTGGRQLSLPIARERGRWRARMVR